MYITFEINYNAEHEMKEYQVMPFGGLYEKINGEWVLIPGSEECYDRADAIAFLFDKHVKVNP